MRSSSGLPLLVASALCALFTPLPARADPPPAASADVEPAPIDVPGEEVIHVHDDSRLVRMPQPKQDPRVLPPYSDEAVLGDRWTKAWLWLDVNDAGVVERVKFIRRPGFGLDDIAVEFALQRRFDPARDNHGNPARALVVFPIEWPSTFWMKKYFGTAQRLPSLGDMQRYHVHVPPCAGSGPLALFSAYPVYRDCSVPDLSRSNAAEPWVTASTPLQRARTQR